MLFDGLCLCASPLLFRLVCDELNRLALFLAVLAAYGHLCRVLLIRIYPSSRSGAGMVSCLWVVLLTWFDRHN